MTHAYMIARLVKLLLTDAMTKSELAEAAGLHHVTISRYVHALHREGVLVIGEWRWGRNNAWVPIYEVNVTRARDAKMPPTPEAKPRTEVWADHRQKKKMLDTMHRLAGTKR